MNTPTQTYRRVDFPVPARLHTGLDASVHRLMGAYARRAGSALDSAGKPGKSTPWLESTSPCTTINSTNGSWNSATSSAAAAATWTSC